MHIMEGFLPPAWCLFWFLVSAPFVVYGMYQLRILMREKREALPLLAVAGAFIFVLSSLKLPSVSGSCSHPTGTGLGAILFGPFITSILGLIVLLYQAVFLAHGGLTTLGANLFSMGIAGPLLAYAIYRGGQKVGLNTYLTVFLAAALADLFTYVVTAAQLALAFPAEAGGFVTSFIAFAAVYAVTQIPLAIIEGAVIALTFKYIIDVRSEILVRLGVLSDAVAARLQEVKA
ncbi:energy-coupling factor ABC transporter permease [Methanofollis aquaemaris]|uniref:Putative cobalt transport protein CbiM n=1 Tax=Methanofollis aquaemaris TaxID=126734 RepID=A0A8A3S3H9_9EURY|nr:energy-coupling factor ABC transporter permease [Methanofollis aquaemaris]QSZ66827.1 energy-coupling factor ABC transporter permease [Methanofollis aquaemaris]